MFRLSQRVSFSVLLFLLALLCALKINAQSSGKLVIHFQHLANGESIRLRDSSYINTFGESYQITKLKYYISNTRLKGNLAKQSNEIYLINAANNEQIITIDQVAPGSYSGIQFLLGIDSLYHFSGAQSGALDPVNDMFWTWNSGYVLFKMEGKSPASTADLNRIEYHLGGYKDSFAIAKYVNLSIPENATINIKAHEEIHVLIKVNLDLLWKGNTSLRIAETPVCVITGSQAVAIALNLSGMFSLHLNHETP